MIAVGADKFSDARKKAILIHCLGDEGHRIYFSICDSTNSSASYTETLAWLEDQFGPKINVVAAHFKFRQRIQCADESINSFYTALRLLVKDCDFGELESDMLRDQIVEKVHNLQIQERLLEDAELTLAKALEIARAMESAFDIANSMHLPSTVHSSDSTASISNPSTSTTDSGFSANMVADTVSDSEVHIHSRYCYRCGSPEHLADFPFCPAKDATCIYCKKVGHSVNVCLSAQKSSSSRNSATTVRHVHDNSVNSDFSDREEECYVLSIADKPSTSTHFCAKTCSAYMPGPTSISNCCYHNTHHSTGSAFRPVHYYIPHCASFCEKGKCGVVACNYESPAKKYRNLNGAYNLRVIPASPD